MIFHSKFDKLGWLTLPHICMSGQYRLGVVSALRIAIQLEKLSCDSGDWSKVFPTSCGVLQGSVLFFYCG